MAMSTMRGAAASASAAAAAAASGGTPALAVGRRAGVFSSLGREGVRCAVAGAGTRGVVCSARNAAAAAAAAAASPSSATGAAAAAAAAAASSALVRRSLSPLSSSPSSSSSSSFSSPAPVRRRGGVAVVGAGPAGLYTVEQLLLQSERVDAVLGGDGAAATGSPPPPPPPRVDVFERLPVPFGLVRFGVAPDHPEMKEPVERKWSARVEAGLAEGRVRFLGGVAVGGGADAVLSVADLLSEYDAVVLASGASTGDRELGIPGEAEGSAVGDMMSAREFVGWYNGHPDYTGGDLHARIEAALCAPPSPGQEAGAEHAVIVGAGNVALDLARVLALRDRDALARTDISDAAVDVLSRSRIRHVHVVARRGMAQAAFTNKELREVFGPLDGCSPVRVALEDTHGPLGPACEEELASSRLRRRMAELVRKQGHADAFPTWRDLIRGEPALGADENEHMRLLSMHFRLQPRSLELTEGGRLRGVQLERMNLEGEPGSQRAVPSGDMATLPCSFALRSVGYRAHPIPGVPFDEARARVPCDPGTGAVEGLPRVFAVGWLARGPSGVIGTNRFDAKGAVEGILTDPHVAQHVHDRQQRQMTTSSSSDLGSSSDDGSGDGASIDDLLQQRGASASSWEDWIRIDAAERADGEARGKPRVKLETWEQLRAAASAVESDA